MPYTSGLFSLVYKQSARDLISIDYCRVRSLSVMGGIVWFYSSRLQ